MRVDRFTYAYAEGGGPSLRDISLELEPGTFTVLAGVSGSGKSTLLRALCGLVPHFHGGDGERRHSSWAGSTCASTARVSWPRCAERSSRSRRPRS